MSLRKALAKVLRRLPRKSAGTASAEAYLPARWHRVQRCPVRLPRFRAALFTHDGDGYQICMPFTQHFQKNGTGLTAVGLPGDVYREVKAAAVAHYRGLEGEPKDSGLRRMIGETMAIAGL